MTNNPAIKVAVFGSSQPKEGSRPYEDAREVGAALAGAGLTVVSGGYRGVMEAASRGAKEAGGSTIGITTAFFDGKILPANQWVDREVKMDSYAGRLLKLAEICDAYIVMRGGSGTLSEFFLVWELVKNGSVPLRPIVLFGDHWQRIMNFLAEELADELSFAKHMQLLKITRNLDEMIRHIEEQIAQ